MECKNATDTKYLNYICYVRYKSRFADVKKEKHFYKEDFIKIKEDHKKEIPPSMQKLLPVVDYLTHYLSDDPIHYFECYNQICCRYISYLLHNKVKDINNSIFNEDIFNYFHSLLKKFYNHERSNRCKTNFDQLTSDDIQKMKILYKLYDDYTDIKELSVENPNERNRICINLAVIVNELNLLSEDHKKDNDLMKKLRDHVNLIKKHPWATNNDCLKNILHLTFDKQVSSAQSQSHDNSEKLRLTNPSSSQDAQVLESTLSSQHDSSGLVDQSEPRLLSGSNQPSQAEAALGSVSRGESGSDDALVAAVLPEIDNGLNDPEILDLQHERRTVGSHTHNSFSTHSPPDDEQINALYKETSTEYPSVNPREKGGFMEQVHSTFSTIVEKVEPAPILGVSGGMGALYLLLRYTPVGSFFGRRRGLNHRIPGGFPGAYPGFPEYYDGNLGNMPINISYQAE